MTPLPYSLFFADAARARTFQAIGVNGGMAHIVAKVIAGGKLLKFRDGELFNTSDDPADIPTDAHGRPEGIYGVALTPKGRFIALYKFEVRK